MRVFAYLKNTASAAAVLRGLEAEGCLTLAYVEGLGEAARKKLASKTLRVADRPVDVAAAARGCDLAVVNGGHGVCAEMLLAGKPVLAVPIVLEQQMTGAALARLGAGAVALPARRAAWAQWGGPVLSDVLTSRTFGESARRFAERYRAFDPQQQRRGMFHRADGLLTAATTRDEPARVAAVA